MIFLRAPELVFVNGISKWRESGNLLQHCTFAPSQNINLNTLSFSLVQSISLKAISAAWMCSLCAHLRLHLTLCLQLPPLTLSFFLRYKLLKDRSPNECLLPEFSPFILLCPRVHSTNTAGKNPVQFTGV